ncbi:hypothetical protein ABLU12_10720 [Acinetobacter indicus]|nr:hypothetical protein [Acinetobacter indicus]
MSLVPKDLNRRVTREIAAILIIKVVILMAIGFVAQRFEMQSAPN